MQEGCERDNPFLEGIVMASLRATDLYVVLWAASSKPQNRFLLTNASHGRAQRAWRVTALDVTKLT